MHTPRHPATSTQTIVQYVLFALGLAVVVVVAVVFFLRYAEHQKSARGVSNCRQIITALRIYSGDHGGSYMDNAKVDDIETPKSSNEDFRILFTEGVLDNEAIFGCPYSPYVPDGKIGTAPKFEDALKAGENHWMQTYGLSDSASGSIPLVYENAAVVEWNPKWNANIKRRTAPGRAWTKGIIIGMNDSSVSLQPLAAIHGSEVPLKAFSEGENLFTQHKYDFEVLDIER
jgi:hypothetical protein